MYQPNCKTINDTHQYIRCCIDEFCNNCTEVDNYEISKRTLNIRGNETYFGKIFNHLVLWLLVHQKNFKGIH